MMMSSAAPRRGRNVSDHAQTIAAAAPSSCGASVRPMGHLLQAGPTCERRSGSVGCLYPPQIDVDAFPLGIKIQGSEAILSADPRLLRAAERHRHRSEIVAVDPYHACFE